MGDVPMEGGQAVAPDPYAEHIKNNGVPVPTEAQVDQMVKDDIEAGWSRITFDVTTEHMATIEDAFNAAKTLANSEHKGHILSLICLHFASFHVSKKSVNVGEWLAQLERLMGLKLD